MPYILRYVLNGKPTERWARNLDAPETTHDRDEAMRFATRGEADGAAGDGPWSVEPAPATGDDLSADPLDDELAEGF